MIAAPFRVKLVLPAVQDAQMFYARSIEEAEEMVRVLERDVLPLAPDARVYLYVETSLGHVRVR